MDRGFWQATVSLQSHKKSDTTEPANMQLENVLYLPGDSSTFIFFYLP